MITKLYDAGIPSERTELIKNVIGLKLVNLIRFSWWSGQESAKQCEISQKDVFSLTAGPLLMYFGSGIVVGAASDPSKNSVIIWTEKNENGEISNNPVDEDEEYFPISVDDKSDSNLDWTSVINQVVKDVRIVKRKPKNIKISYLPNEVGLLFILENDIRFLLSHGLHNDSDDFSVIFEKQIRNDILLQLNGIV